MRIFWSYARTDDKKPRKLTKVREAFSVVLDQTTGSENQVIVDVMDLRWGMPWKKAIEELLLSSHAMVAVISPSYFKSRYCIYELKLASENGIKICPLYLRTAKEGLVSRFEEDGYPENRELNQASKLIETLEYKDFRELRNKKIGSEKVQNFLDELADELA